jgi:ATP-dependent Clp protease protease subunit
MTEHKIFISGDIIPFGDYNDCYSIQSLNNDLNGLKNVAENDTLIVDINTFGGDTETGFAMYNQLRRFKTENKINLTTRVTGYCASIGTVILLAGDKRIGNKLNQPFVHNAWTLAVGDSNEMQKIADDLQKTNEKIASLYAERTNIDKDKALEIMQNNDFIDPNKVLEYGFYTELENETFNNLNYSLKMNIQEQIVAIYNKLFTPAQTKNIIVYASDNTEVDFYELADGEPIVVGAKANVGSAPAQGEIVMISGETYVFDNGTLTEIKEVESDDIEALKNEIEALKSENQTLKESQNALTAENSKLVEFRNKVLNLKTNEPAPAPKAKEKETPQNRIFNIYPEKK